MMMMMMMMMMLIRPIPCMHLGTMIDRMPTGLLVDSLSATPYWQAFTTPTCWPQQKRIVEYASVRVVLEEWADGKALFSSS